MTSAGAGASDGPYRDPADAAAYSVSVGGWSPYDAVYDIPGAGKPSRTYLMATTQRSGSHLLAHAMARRGAGIPLEYANPFLAELELMRQGRDITDDERWSLLCAVRRRRTTAAGVFGFKAHWHHWRRVLDEERVRELLKPAAVIYVQRQDVLAQAVSLAVARRTGSWISFHPGRADAAGPFDAQAVSDALHTIIDEQAAWEMWFASVGLVPLRLCYEHISADSAGLAQLAANHIDSCPAPAPAVDQADGLPQPSPQRDATKVNWLRRAREEIAQPNPPSPMARCCD